MQNKCSYTDYIERQLGTNYKGNIILYGSGIIAKKVIPELTEDNYNIVGVIDAVKFEGEVCSIPIICWEDVEKLSADVIVICAKVSNHRIIYNRIKYLCHIYNLRIISSKIDPYFTKYTPKDQIIFSKNEDELKQLIDSHEAISFDMFDTLVMRKTLEPADVFDIVEQRIASHGIFIPEFKKKRRTAEINSNGTINDIYKNLSERLNLNEEITNKIKEEELCVEKEVLVARNAVVSLLNYAHEQGKKVYIISDMYWSGKILSEILYNLGIINYDRILVSCDYNCSKSNGLFDVYKKMANAESYLHIGDNFDCDCYAAKRNNIDYYKIESGNELIKLSNIEHCLYFMKTLAEKTLIGNIVSVLFNNPFSLYQTNGVVSINNEKELSAFISFPICILYMKKLMDVVKNNNYDAILFGTRDGKLFYRIYKELFKESFSDKKVRGVYFVTSRQLCIQAAAGKNIALEEVLKTFEEKYERLYVALCQNTGYEDRLSLSQDNNCLTNYIKNNYKDICKYNQSESINYIKYIKKCGIKQNRKYILTDLTGRGTMQFFLNKIYYNVFDGFYLSFFYQKIFDNDLTRYSALEDNLWSARNNNSFYEKIFTDVIPSAKSIDSDGRVVFCEDKRTQEELNIIECIHEETLFLLRSYYQEMGYNVSVSDKFVNCLMNCLNLVHYTDNIEAFMNSDLQDELLSDYIKCEIIN